MSVTDEEIKALQQQFKKSIDYVQRDSDIWLAEDVADEPRSIVQTPSSPESHPAQGRLLPEQANASWGLDAIDQEGLPLDSFYGYEYYGKPCRLLP